MSAIVASSDRKRSKARASSGAASRRATSKAIDNTRRVLIASPPLPECPTCSRTSRSGSRGQGAPREAGVSFEDVTRRVIFLDIDGVLAPIRRWDRYVDLDPACIRVLNVIVAGAGADVVVSSTWRHGKTTAELQEMLEAKGFIGCLLDKTPTGAPGADRGDEIAAWLAEH